ncbi:MAG TPA: DUF2059 domain-containing protein [Longimicrobium sp.]|nr:DUF2059 domain-containing protein [Longimicrobium sp.]
MNKLILAAALLLCAAVPAAAQEEPSAGEVAAARELLEASLMRENLVRTVTGMMEQGMGETLPPEMQAVMKRFFEEHFRFEDMEPGLVRMYADLFTEEEIRAATAFYRTPAGRRMAELTPEVAVRSQQVSMELMEAAMPQLMRMMEEAMEAAEAAENAPGNATRS